jgi:hypothetical protein
MPKVPENFGTAPWTLRGALFAVIDEKSRRAGLISV